MITRYQSTKGDIIGLAVLIVVMAILWMFFPVLLCLLPDSRMSLYSSEVGWNLLGTFLSGVAFMLFFRWKFFAANRCRETYLLSSKTLAVLHPDSPVRYIKPHDISFVKPDTMTPILNDGTALTFPGIVVGAKVNLGRVVVKRWYGKETLRKATLAYRNTFRLKTWTIGIIIALVSVALLIALGLTSVAAWSLFAALLNALFYGSAVLLFLYVGLQQHLARKLRYPLCAQPGPPLGADEIGAPERGVGSLIETDIRRYPRRRTRAFDHYAAPVLVLLGLGFFVPLMSIIFSFNPLDSLARDIVLLVAFELILVAAFCLWRIYQMVIQSNALVTVLLSSRTMAIIRPRRPVVYVKKGQCAALIMGRNELILNDGRHQFMGIDREWSEGSGICATICRQWWPEVLEETENATPPMSASVERQIVIGAALSLISLGAFGMHFFLQNMWFTIMAFHLFMGGIVFISLGVQRCARWYGHTISLRSEAEKTPQEASL